jgi:hypothetical protein
MLSIHIQPAECNELKAMKRILIVENHEVLRDGVKRVSTNNPERQSSAR